MATAAIHGKVAKCINLLDCFTSFAMTMSIITRLIPLVIARRTQVRRGNPWQNGEAH